MTKEKIQHNFFFILLGVMTVAGLFLLSPYADVFFIAIMFAIIFRPMHRWIREKLHGRNTASAVISTIVVMLVVLVPLSLFGYQIFNEAKGLYISIADGGLESGIIANMVNVLQQYVPQVAPTLAADIGQYVGNGLQWVVTNLGAVFSSAVAMIVNFIFILFTLFFLFRDEDIFRKMILAVSPLEDTHSSELLDTITAAIASVTKGTIMVAFLQGILAGIGFAVAGVPSPVLWASVAAFAAMIPAVGTGLVVVPAIIFLAFTGHVVAAIALAIWGIGVVGLVDNFLRPALLSRGIKIHPLVILFSTFGGLKFFGIVGFFLGPVVLAILFAMFEMYPRIIGNHTQEGEV
ncbi:MAG: hypothetical protein ACD_81C00096G0005 [uncultured bacterium]|uniref:Permease n=1 Tax=Candidatus Wolfebacteria bacterium GW2011_GWE2_44_13 TaxID=1619017 RepID=A0A0G1K564_9BACT|nr:MAG: hypothetical protein ACD_81C00096G0005 [uncultured bacterium]KKT42994.1 MAG: hypothetical protein UW32_C0003G0097 [Candidatus Wolfebacteria bacterium GW2011_GWE2_44_13]HBT74763.1 hypothetical protein [Candidatus Wolfebacteria bacterium]